MPSVIRVAVPTPLRRSFDYLPPKGMRAENIPAGARVKVPFGRRTAIGIVIGHSDNSDVPTGKLRPIGSLLDPPDLIPADMLALATWAAGYYHHPIGEVMAAVLPVLLRKGGVADNKGPKRYSLTPAGKQAAQTLSGRAPRQHAILKRLEAAGRPVSAEVFEDMEGDWKGALRTLIKKDWLERTQLPCLPDNHVHQPDKPTPNDEQQAAIAEVCESLGSFQPFLLDGVTGSGKTEVYLRIIEATLAAGKQALVLVPEIGLTPQLVARFRDRLPVPIAVMHSALTDTERQCAWLKAREGHARVVIGTRSAAFTPLPEPGVFIIDEEHDPSFKQQEGFRYSARDLLLVRGQRSHVPVVMGSATPSLESLYNVQRSASKRLVLSQRAGGASPPRLQVLDIRNQPLCGGLSRDLITAMQLHLKRGHQVLLFLNRRGFAPILNCHHCGWMADCERCDAHLVVHQREHNLRCHHCGHEQRLPPRCPECGGEKLIRVGQGTERLEQELAEHFSEHVIVRIDRDSTRRKGSLDAALERVISGEARILVGTQMLAKGHHFPKVTLVGIVDADGGLFGADFRSAERMSQQILQVAGRAGREGLAGEVLIQSRHPESDVLRALITRGYGALAEELLKEREIIMLPPFSALALLRAEAHQKEEAVAFLQQIKELTSSGDIEGVQILGPAPAAMERRAGRYRMQLLLQATRRVDLHAAVRLMIYHLENMKSSRKVRWSMDIDPQDVA